MPGRGVALLDGMACPLFPLKITPKKTQQHFLIKFPQHSTRADVFSGVFSRTVPSADNRHFSDCGTCVFPAAVVFQHWRQGHANPWGLSGREFPVVRLFAFPSFHSSAAGTPSSNKQADVSQKSLERLSSFLVAFRNSSYPSPSCFLSSFTIFIILVISLTFRFTFDFKGFQNFYLVFAHLALGFFIETCCIHC